MHTERDFPLQNFDDDRGRHKGMSEDASREGDSVPIPLQRTGLGKSPGPRLRFVEWIPSTKAILGRVVHLLRCLAHDEVRDMQRILTRQEDIQRNSKQQTRAYDDIDSFSQQRLFLRFSQHPICVFGRDCA